MCSYSDEFLDQIKEPLDAYIDRVLRLDVIYEIYFSMNYDSKWEFLFDSAPAYFNTVRKSIQESLILNTIILLEDKGRSKSNINKFIEELTRTIEKYQYPVPNYVQNIKDYIEGIKHREIKHLKTWRDKYLAHLDKEYFLDPSKLSEDAPLGRDNLRKVISTLLDLLCNLYSHFFNVIYQKMMNRTDFENLFRFESLHNKEKQERMTQLKQYRE